MQSMTVVFCKSSSEASLGYLRESAVLDLGDFAVIVVADFGAFALHFDKLNVGPGDLGLVAKELLQLSMPVFTRSAPISAFLIKHVKVDAVAVC